MPLTRRTFSEINLAAPFFDSLREDYPGFDAWFRNKAVESAYVFTGNDGSLDGFLYLKIEDGAVEDVTPPLRVARRLKIGTFKINPHGTRLGERFLKKVFDHALAENVDELYVTVFPKHTALLKLFETYGFRKVSTKGSTGSPEDVLLRPLLPSHGTLKERYPVVRLSGQAVFSLSIKPQWHTRLFPDSILVNEDASIVADITHTNSIHKVYLAAMRGMERLRTGDVVVMYRTSDEQGAAYYRSVVTSICVVEEYRNIFSFGSQEDFLAYCAPYSVFEEHELIGFWRTKKYPHVVRFTYNYALKKRLTRAHLIENVGIDANAYAGFMELSHSQLRKILSDSNSNESFVVD